jgi:predicted GIY-YIG superfamily endonuclease
MADTFALYAIRLPVNDYAVAYIGVTKNERGRLREHRKEHKLISDAIRSCGHDAVVFQVLARGKRAFIYELEIKAIAAFGTRSPKGYNVAAGGIGGRDWLPCMREKASASHKGVPKSADHRAKIGASHQGRKRKPFSLETKTRMSIAKRGERHNLYGMTPSAASRAKNAASQRRLLDTRFRDDAGRWAGAGHG